MTNSIDNDVLSSLGLARQPEKKPAGELGQEDFLKLMIAQLRHQDPFSPMENGDFLGQIAQFGTVSGIDEVRSALEGLSSALGANQTMQAASLVDRQAYVNAREAWLPPEGEVHGIVEAAPGVAEANVSVYDLSGSLVTSFPVPLSGDTAGEFVWDGRMSDGTIAPSGYYELKADGDVGGASTEFDVLVAGRIESVAMQGTGGRVEVTVTGLGRIDLGDVRRVG